MLQILRLTLLLPSLLLLLPLSPQLANAAFTTVNVTVDNEVVHLVRSPAELGELYQLDRSAPLFITCRAETELANDVPGRRRRRQAASRRRQRRQRRQALLKPTSFDWRRVGSNSSVTAVGQPTAGRATFRVECSADSLSCVSVLRILEPVNADVGPYECRVTPWDAERDRPLKRTRWAVGAFQSRPLITLTVGGTDKYDLAVGSEDTVDIVCRVEGYPEAGPVRWTRQAQLQFNQTATDRDSMRLSGLAYPRDRGDLTCHASNDFGANRATLFLRVKNPRAFLPPLLAIMAEAVAMLAIILTYEFCLAARRRGQNALDQLDVAGGVKTE